MKVYDLKGMFLIGREAIIAVLLPKPLKNAYVIFNIYNVSDDNGNKTVIHLKDLSKPPLKAADDHLEIFTIQFDGKDFDNFDFTKETTVALVHHNADNLPNGKTPSDIYDDVYAKEILPTDFVGKGIIRP